MPRRKQEWPNDKVDDIDWWDEEIEGIVFRFVIRRVTKEKSETRKRRIYYPVAVRRADDQYLNLGNAFDNRPTREQVATCFPKEELIKNFRT